MPLNLRSIVGVPSGHFVCIQFSQNSWKRLARLEQHSRNGPWTRNQSFSWMLLYVRVVNTLVVSPFEVPGRDASEANKEKNKKNWYPKKMSQSLVVTLWRATAQGISPFAAARPRRPNRHCSLYDYCSQFFPRVATDFFVSTIYQVIWPSPCSLITGEKVAKHKKTKPKINYFSVPVRKHSNIFYCLRQGDKGHNLAQVLKPNTSAQTMLLLSHLLRSAWNTLKQDCWSFQHSL